MINLWPAEITEVSEVTPPITILDQQALMLGNMTKNIILGETKAKESENFDFSYAFYLVAPILDNYRYKLLTIYHSIELYPVIIQVEEGIYEEISEDLKDKIVSTILKSITLQTPNSFQAKSEDEFLIILKAIFNSNKTRRVISALLAQSSPESKAS